MILFADCGNSRIKLALGDDRVRLPAEPGGLAGWLGGRIPVELVLLPGAAATTAVVRSWWHGTIREVGRDIPLPGCGQYPGMGHDRILAGLAAGPGRLVVDAGTATTLTAWDAAGRFAGGLILPGVHAMLAGLATAAPALPLVLPAYDSPAAQRDTHGAIAAAAGIGHPAMVSACLRRLQSETGVARVVATGGGAAQLAAAGVLPTDAIRPWLVLEGLARLAG